MSGSSVHRKNSTFEHFHFQHLNHGSCVWDQFYFFKNFNVRKKTEGKKFQIETTEAFLAGAASSFSSGIHSPVRQTWDIYAACPPPPENSHRSGQLFVHQIWTFLCTGFWASFGHAWVGGWLLSIHFLCHVVTMRFARVSGAPLSGV